MAWAWTLSSMRDGLETGTILFTNRFSLVMKRQERSDRVGQLLILTILIRYIKTSVNLGGLIGLGV